MKAEMPDSPLQLILDLIKISQEIDKQTEDVVELQSISGKETIETVNQFGGDLAKEAKVSAGKYEKLSTF